MNSTTESAKAEGTTAPASVAGVPAKDRAVAAIESWYAKHFHRAQTTGSVCIGVDEKTALVEHVTAALR